MNTRIFKSYAEGYRHYVADCARDGVPARPYCAFWAKAVGLAVTLEDGRARLPVDRLPEVIAQLQAVR